MEIQPNFQAPHLHIFTRFTPKIEQPSNFLYNEVMKNPVPALDYDVQLQNLLFSTDTPPLSHISDTAMRKKLFDNFGFSSTLKSAMTYTRFMVGFILFI